MEVVGISENKTRDGNPLHRSAMDDVAELFRRVANQTEAKANFENNLKIFDMNKKDGKRLCLSNSGGFYPLKIDFAPDFCWRCVKIRVKVSLWLAAYCERE